MLPAVGRENGRCGERARERERCSGGEIARREWRMGAVRRDRSAAIVLKRLAVCAAFGLCFMGNPINIEVY